MLVELGDHSHDEIAEVLGVRREKVKALVFQAREALRRLREARETPCVEIREQLATLRGSALRRADAAPPRRALRGLRGVRDRGAPPARRDGAAAAGGADRRAEGGGPRRRRVGGGAGAGAGGGSLAGLGGAAKGLAAKTMLCAAVAGSAGSAGYVAVREVQMHDARGDVPAAASHARTAPAGRGR